MQFITLFKINRVLDYLEKSTDEMADIVTMHYHLVANMGSKFIRIIPGILRTVVKNHEKFVCKYTVHVNNIAKWVKEHMNDDPAKFSEVLKLYTEAFQIIIPLVEDLENADDQKELNGIFKEITNAVGKEMKCFDNDIDIDKYDKTCENISKNFINLFKKSKSAKETTTDDILNSTENVNADSVNTGRVS